ncbi:hypothetical protein MKZ38_008866 [Zalerion maritima]|uniref:DUF7707 domain-containing protein n=1 Tax=Zalerion maritima TaxID=339359 RepID=A0AAD5RGD6_9PEZI|nr:hypothetical protein MKZ38_008866 [Zalerion maritima]
MRFSTSTFVTALLVTVAKADYIIDPETVSESNREYWCQSEVSTCPLICEQINSGDTLVNDCDPETLTYGCICSNGLAPNVSEYTLTLPYFTCVEWGTQCVEDCGSNNACANSCREDHPCGAQEPTAANSTTTATSASSSSTSTSESEDAIHTSVLGEDDGDSNSNSAIAMGRSYGLAMVAGGLFVGFALL